ncbi:LaaN protein, partial [Streptococcus thermophilus]|nr:LaaN protein [Streptococcus thermophilus]
MGVPLWLTMLGRLVFPIFLFLAADSFHYTHDRLAYLRRLLYMSWFMTIGNAIILLPILSSIPVVVLAG